jgi:hypothetical protein
VANVIAPPRGKPRLKPGASSGSHRIASCFIGRCGSVSRLMQASTGRDVPKGRGMPAFSLKIEPPSRRYHNRLTAQLGSFGFLWDRSGC